MQDYNNLKVWQKSHQLTRSVYQQTRSFPREEIYGLTGQIRRAAASIPSNIAEGCCRFGDAELARFLCIAAGSASELEYHILLSKDLQYLNSAVYDNLTAQIVEIKCMLIAFIKKLKD